MELLGIDVGGSGIKAAIVDTKKGKLITEKLRLETPQPALPESVSETIHKLVKEFGYKGKVGCGFPTVIRNGRCRTYGNLHPQWLDIKVTKLFKKATGRKFYVINDADAAALAEMSFGAGKGEKGLVVTITIGTGIGSGFFYKGCLIPNIEMGRVLGKDGRFIEAYASDRARQAESLDWQSWGERFNYFLDYLIRVTNPDLIILGGGASKKYDLFKEKITVDTPVRTARFRNRAGILGAAMAAEKKL